MRKRSFAAVAATLPVLLLTATTPSHADGGTSAPTTVTTTTRDDGTTVTVYRSRGGTSDGSGFVNGVAQVGTTLSLNIPAGVTRYSGIFAILPGCNQNYYTRSQNMIYAPVSVAPQDLGQFVFVKAVWSDRPNYNGNVIGHFLCLGPIVAGDIAGTPTISGKAAILQTLTVSTAAMTPGNASFTYAWEADGAVIDGETASTFTIPVTDLGKKITAVVTGSAPAYNTGTFSSAPTAAVALVSLG